MRKRGNPFQRSDINRSKNGLRYHGTLNFLYMVNLRPANTPPFINPNLCYFAMLYSRDPIQITLLWTEWVYAVD